MKIYTIDRDCNQAKFWREGHEINIGVIEGCNDTCITVFYSLLKELLSNPRLKEFRLETPKDNFYKFVKFVIGEDDEHIYIDSIDEFGETDRSFLFNRGRAVKVDLRLVLAFAKSHIDLIETWIAKHPAIDCRYETVITCDDDWMRYDAFSFKRGNLLATDIDDIDLDAESDDVE